MPMEAERSNNPIPCTPWYPSVAPFEAGNQSCRNHVYELACSAVGDGHPAKVMATARQLPNVYNAVTRQPDELFVLAGAYGYITESNAPMVTALEADSLRERWRTRLPGMAPSDWNYPGVLGVHANGALYAVYGHHIACLDPTTGAVRAHSELPTNQSPRDVAYNGFVLLSDGRIATKSIHRLPGSSAPDFKALLEGNLGTLAPSTLVLIDPVSLAVLQTVIAPENIRFRLTATLVDRARFSLFAR